MRLIFFLLSVSVLYSQAQHKGSITGRVLDRNVQNPLPYSVIKLVKDTALVVESDSLGFFILNNIPVGTYLLQVVCEGYKTAQYPILIEQSVISKQSVYMEEDITVLSEVVLHSEQDNPYKVTSSYQFEAKDFGNSASSFGDPLRLVQTLPAVATTSDGNNQVAVRGNSPFNNNWYLEGMEIPNPNHFGGYGSSGGFVSVFNENTLEKFDFYLGAYPAMYGNSNSSVFDMKLRAGNMRKREQHVRISPLGVYAGAEGYFKKGSKSSYIINARIFDLYFFNKWGIVPKENFTIPSFKDFSYKIFIPSKNDRLEISLFGFGGSNTLKLIYSDNREDKHNLAFCNNLSFDFKKSNRVRINSTFQWSKIDNGLYWKQPIAYSSRTREEIWRNHTYIQFKHSAKLSYRTGFRLALRNIDVLLPQGPFYDTTLRRSYYTNINKKVHGLTSEAYFSSIYRCSEATKLVLGIYAINVSFNRRVNVEPRIGITSQITKHYELGFSSGFYSKVASYYVYASSKYDLPQTRSFQVVNSHTFKIDSSFHIKSELFYQYIWNMYLTSNPQLPEIAFLSTDNLFAYKDQRVDILTKGKNYGIDINIHKKFDHKIEAVFAGAVYRSLYMNSGKVWTNTMYDNKFTSSVQISKESIKLKSYGVKSFLVSAKILYFGGFYVIPLDYRKSVLYNSDVFQESFLYNHKLPNYFRLDLGCQLSYSRKNIKHELRFDIQNATNRKNPLKQYFNKVDKSIKYVYQLPIIPVVSYTGYF